jgi:DNA-binding IclR family transcriptional regulator
MSYAPEVQTGGEEWNGNALRFATKEEAEANVRHLMGRWMLVTATRVVESDDAVNYRWIEGKGLVSVNSDAEQRMPAERVTL